MSKYEGHTPGPWEYRPTKPLGEHHSICPAVIIGGSKLSINRCGDSDLDADAKLIADAPMLAEQNEKMLAMLKRLRDYYCDRGIILWQDNQSLIAEIEGEK